MNATDRSGAAPAAPTTYHERLWPSPGTLAGLGAIAVGLVLAFVPLGPVGALWGLGAVLVLCAALVVLMSPVVSCDGTYLRAGNARVPLSVVAGVRELTGDELTHALGTGLDARAHLCVRGWVRSAVRVDLADPDDPVPYWLVSARRGDLLVQAAHSRQTA